MIRLAALILALLLPMSATAQDDALTETEVAEMVVNLRALLVGVDRPGLVEENASQLYQLIDRDLGTETRQALEVEAILMTAIQRQSRYDEAVVLGRYTLSKAQRLLKADDTLAYEIVAIHSLSLSLIGETDAGLRLLDAALKLAEGNLPVGADALVNLRFMQAQIALDDGQFTIGMAALDRMKDHLAGRDDQFARHMATTGLLMQARALENRGAFELALPIVDQALPAVARVFETVKNPRMPKLYLQAVETKARVLVGLGRHDQVEPFLAPLLAEVADYYGDDGQTYADLAVPLAIALGGRGDPGPRVDEALALYAKIVDIRTRLLAPNNTDLIKARLDYALLLSATGDHAKALSQMEHLRDTASLHSRAQYVYVLRTAQEAGAITQDQAVDRILTYLQNSQTSAAARSQLLLNARLSAGTNLAASFLRDRSDISARVAGLQYELSLSAAQPQADRNAVIEADLSDRLTKALAAQSALEDRIRSDVPDLANLTGLTALDLGQIRAGLGPDGALVLIDMPQNDDDYGLLVAVTAQAVDWHTIKAPSSELVARIADLRAGIALRLGVRAAQALEPQTLPVQDFDHDAALWLYSQLIEPLADVIADKPDLYFDLRGSITALPPQLLIRNDPDASVPVDWLIRHHTVAILPSIAALTPAQKSDAPPVTRLMAFANPHFAGLSQDTPAPLRGALAPLPETADEVTRIAAYLGADAAALKLGDAATEAMVKSTNLADFGTLYFATHGLVSGDIVGAGGQQLQEPALALTAGQGEDGFLGASEIAGLRLNARWVVLSACNTAQGNEPAAEALSGLAQAFLYAGARGLLVSHWPVESKSAVALMTDTFRRLGGPNPVPMARAQQQAILKMIDTPANPRWSHPAYWAPFVLVGDPG